MYNFFFNPDVFTISLSIYLLALLCLVLAVKLLKAERDNKKNLSYILYLHDRISKLEEGDQQ